MELDKFDRQLLVLLQNDGRMANQALAEAVGLSAAACWRRVKALTENGVFRHLQPSTAGSGGLPIMCIFDGELNSAQWSGYAGV